MYCWAWGLERLKQPDTLPYMAKTQIYIKVYAFSISFFIYALLKIICLTNPLPCVVWWFANVLSACDVGEGNLIASTESFLLSPKSNTTEKKNVSTKKFIRTTTFSFNQWFWKHRKESIQTIDFKKYILYDLNELQQKSRRTNFQLGSVKVLFRDTESTWL